MTYSPNAVLKLKEKERGDFSGDRLVTLRTRPATFAAEKIGSILTFKLTNQEGQRLTACMLAMRPDWTKNNPGQLLAEANTMGLPGHDFGHALRAIAAYCTARDDSGGWQYRTPNIYPQDGKHWTATAPTDWVRAKAPPCADHPESEAHTCRGCHADVKTGYRPASHIGKRWRPPTETTESPEAPATAGAFVMEGTK